MDLIGTRTRYVFRIDSQNFDYLMKVFDLDLSFDIHHTLLYGDVVEVDEALAMADKLETILNDKNMYEYCSNNNGIIPVLNPSQAALSDGFILNPISQERSEFLKKLTDVFRRREKLSIR